MSYWRWAAVPAILLLAASIGGGWLWHRDHQTRQEIAEIETEIAAGRHALAARRLTQFLDQNPGHDQAAYLLGTCEKARGHNDQALEAWARVAPGSSFSSRAISERLGLLITLSQFAHAEEMIDQVAEDPRVNRAAIRILLLPLFSQEGRDADAQRLVEERWEGLHATGEETTELAINLARLSLELQWLRPPIEAARADLDRAASLNPDDDRIWLGQANLAIRAGSLDIAERLLDACQKRRPNDAALWRSRLNWAMAANRPEPVRQSREHLPAGVLTSSESDRVVAWLAASQGDRVREREALERVVKIDRANPTALKRLVELARHDGQADRAAELERQSAEIARLNERLHKLYDRNQPIRDSLEIGQLAGKLGHPFVARVFLTLAAAKSLHPGEAKQMLAEFADRGGAR